MSELVYDEEQQVNNTTSFTVLTTFSSNRQIYLHTHSSLASLLRTHSFASLNFRKQNFLGSKKTNKTNSSWLNLHSNLRTHTHTHTNLTRLTTCNSHLDPIPVPHTRVLTHHTACPSQTHASNTHVKHTCQTHVNPYLDHILASQIAGHPHLHHISISIHIHTSIHIPPLLHTSTRIPLL